MPTTNFGKKFKYAYENIFDILYLKQLETFLVTFRQGHMHIQ